MKRVIPGVGGSHDITIFTGDCRDVLRSLASESVHCVVTSPPYFGLRDYKIPSSIWGGDPTCEHVFADKKRTAELRKGAGLAALGERMKGSGHKQGQVPKVEVTTGFCIHCNAWRGNFGLEPDYKLYIEHSVEIFCEVWRVLRKDGTVFLNLGDSYATGAGAGAVGEHPGGGEQGARWSGSARQHGGKGATNNGRTVDWGSRSRAMEGNDHKGRGSPGKANGSEDNSDRPNYCPMTQPNRMPQPGLKPKDMCGIPWRVALALQDDGWWLRRDIIISKKNPMPESTYDRCTTAHEYLFMFAKSGNTLCWRHRDGQWTWKKPKADYRWRHRYTRRELIAAPADVDALDDSGNTIWIKVNLWRGFDYYYDFAAIMEKLSPDSHARAARDRSANHKWAGGGPSINVGQGPQTIAIQPPVAGRMMPKPAGWDDGDGHHGSVHRDGRRHRKLGQHDTNGPRIKSNDSFDEALTNPVMVAMRSKRSVWEIATEPFAESHFAVFPQALVEPCILAGCPKGGMVLDLFGGSGTVAVVADRLGRSATLIEINPQYVQMAVARIEAARMGEEAGKRHMAKMLGKTPKEELPLFADRVDQRDTTRRNYILDSTEPKVTGK